MSDRAAFEKKVNLYNGDIWYKDSAYMTLNPMLGAESVRVNEMFRIWQAAKADGKPPTGYAPCVDQCEAIAARKMIEQLKTENEKQLELLAEIQDMCIGEVAMGYKLDTDYVGRRIHHVTGLVAGKIPRPPE